MLHCPSWHTRRTAAEAAGRIGDPKAIPAIFQALTSETNDRGLDHSLTYALIEIGDGPETAKGLTHESPRVRRAVLAALENIPKSELTPKAVLNQLESKDAALKETAWWIVGRHPEWGEHLVGYFRERMAGLAKMTPPEQDELVARAIPLLKSEPIRKAVGDVLAGMTDTNAARAILRGLARSGQKAFPTEWTEGVLLALYSRDNDAVSRCAERLALVAADHARPLISSARFKPIASESMCRSRRSTNTACIDGAGRHGFRGRRRSYRRHPPRSARPAARRR